VIKNFLVKLSFICFGLSCLFQHGAFAVGPEMGDHYCDQERLKLRAKFLKEFENEVAAYNTAVNKAIGKEMEDKLRVISARLANENLNYDDMEKYATEYNAAAQTALEEGGKPLFPSTFRTLKPSSSPVFENTRSTTTSIHDHINLQASTREGDANMYIQWPGVLGAGVRMGKGKLDYLKEQGLLPEGITPKNQDTMAVYVERKFFPRGSANRIVISSRSLLSSGLPDPVSLLQYVNKLLPRLCRAGGILGGGFSENDFNNPENKTLRIPTSASTPAAPGNAGH